MNLLIKQATVVDPSSPQNGHTVDLFIENGIVSKIGNKLSSKAGEVFDANSYCISPGWVDVFANFSDPGYEFKETLNSGAAAAAAGGFTDVFVIPNTKPAIDNRAQVEYIHQRSAALPINVHAIGAITRNSEGKELAEMYDMRSSGSVAFSDGLQSIQSSGLLTKALQYVKAFNGIIIQLPDDKSVNPHGLMNEGIISTVLGLPGKPALAEELIVSRDINLAEYTGSRLHLSGISTKRSVEYVRDAKKNKIPITCSVTPYHLYFSDDDLHDYDSNLKVNPPLRTKQDRDALRDAVNDGIIDCIASHHLPHEIDSKVSEFEYAKFGMIGLESAFGAIRASMPKLSLEALVKLFSITPRKVFGLPECSIRENMSACFTIFDPKQEWTFNESDIRSKSKNSGFIGRKLVGKSIAIINKGKLLIQTS